MSEQCGKQEKITLNFSVLCEREKQWTKIQTLISSLENWDNNPSIIAISIELRILLYLSYKLPSKPGYE